MMSTTVYDFYNDILKLSVNDKYLVCLFAMKLLLMQLGSFFYNFE
jgi:hypothetical protein